MTECRHGQSIWCAECARNPTAMREWPGDASMLAPYTDVLADEEICATATEWAGRYRWITDSSTPGKFDPADNPPLNAVADACSPSHPCKRVVLCKCNQSGGTVTAFNVAGYCIHQHPGNILWVVPLDKDVKEFFPRVDAFLGSSPAIRHRVGSSALVSATGRATNRIGMVTFRGGYLKVAASGLAVTYQQEAYMIVIQDDRSRFQVNPEGSHSMLAARRTNTYNRMGSKVFVISTPASEPDAVWAELAQSSWNECHVPCPTCGVHQVLIQANLRWTAGAPSTAHFVCAHRDCKAAIYEQRKTWMLERHEWRPRQPQYSGTVEGFHFPAYYARSVYRSWADIADTREKAVEQLKLNDHEPLQVSVNLDEAKPWTPPELVKLAGIERDVFNRREPEAVMLGDAMARGLTTTCGTDRQHKRLESGVWRWGPGREGWSLEHAVHRGDTLQNDVWNRWFDWLVTTGTTAVCVDGADQTKETCGQITRFLDPESERNFYRAGILVWVIKGADRPGPIWPKAIESGNLDLVTGMVQLVSIKVDELTGVILNSLYDVAGPGPGYLHIPRTRDQTWVKQLFGRRQRLSTDPRGGGTYIEVKGRRREVLDYTKYALAALHGAAALGDPAALHVLDIAGPPPPPPPPIPRRPTRSEQGPGRRRARKRGKYQL